MLANEVVGEVMTLCLVALALGLDAFSVCIGMGMRSMYIRQMFKISFVNGLFHMLMPLLGIIVGRFISDMMGAVAVNLGGIILVLFGLNMIYSSMFGDDSGPWLKMTGWGLILFSIGVSIDSFSVGLSLGIFNTNMWLSIILFGLAGFALTMAGLLVGSKAGGWIGEYSEAIGGIILLGFGLRIIL